MCVFVCVYLHVCLYVYPERGHSKHPQSLRQAPDEQAGEGGQGAGEEEAQRGNSGRGGELPSQCIYLCYYRQYYHIVTHIINLYCKFMF